MNFVHMSYLPLVLGLFCLFAVLVLFFEFRYFRWIKRYWFFKRTWINRLSTFFYLLGVFLLLASLLDLRGNEIRIKAQIPDQKTIILLDTSMSMLAEDVRPNRFQRALLLAKHFVSKAVGHQVSVVVFSDTQKRIVPFTDDIDLLDSRISGLQDLNLENAGSNLRQSLLETVQYLREEAGEGQAVTGNILIFSDAEEQGEELKVNVPESVNVAFVGIGTLQGAAIPIRSGSGNYKYFDSFKQYKGEKVVTKLDEDFIRKLGSSIKNYKYWIASSYSMPTDEILSFFRDIFKKKAAQGDVRIRPVMYEYLVVPGVISLALGCLLTLPKTFTMVFFLFFVFQSGTLRAQDEEKQEKKKELSPQTKLYLEKLKKGELDPKGKLKLGELLLKENMTPSALEIYKENYSAKESSDDVTFNYGTAQLKAGKVSEGIETLYKLKKKLEAKDDKRSREMISQIENNIALAFNSEQKKNQKQDKKQDEKKDEKKEDKKENKKDSQKGNSKDDKNKQDKQDNKQNQQQKPGEQKDKENKKKEEEKKDKEKQKEDEKKKQEEQEKKQEEQRPKSLEEKEEQIKKQRMMKQVPAMLKELMNVDRQLQQKYIDTRTKEKMHTREKKDW